MEIQDIVQAVDLVAYVAQYCELERRPDGCFWGLTPFQEERTPSFHVDPRKQLFYDFSTGFGGDALTFAARYNGVRKSEAVELLKAFAGIQEGGGAVHLSAARVAKKFRRLPRPEKGLDRPALPDDYMDTMYENAPGKRAVWRAEGIGDASMDRFQVRYDSVSNRLVFPVRDMQGRIVNVCGRTLDEDFKEKGIPKYIYARSVGALRVIFGFPENEGSIREAGELILFEGGKSVMLADTWGVRNTGAILTSHISEWQARALIRLRLPVCFALDSDVDVRADKQILRLRRYVRVSAILDTEGLLGPKMAPVDAGLPVWEELYRHKTRL